MIPGRGGGLRASIRGHLLKLAEPSPAHRLAPTPDDLFITSIASELAWSTRHFLRAHGLPDDVSGSAEWRRLENPLRLAEVGLTITVDAAVEAMSDSLEDPLPGGLQREPSVSRRGYICAAFRELKAVWFKDPDGNILNVIDESM